jgi:hypothetical protein
MWPTGNLRARHRHVRGAQLQGYHDGEPVRGRRGKGRRSSLAAVSWRLFLGGAVLVDLRRGRNEMVLRQWDNARDLAAGGCVSQVGVQKDKER